MREATDSPEVFSWKLNLTAREVTHGFPTNLLPYSPSVLRPQAASPQQPPGYEQLSGSQQLS